MSNQSLRKFRRDRELHHAEVRQHEAVVREARLKGPKVASPADMVRTILGVNTGLEERGQQPPVPLGNRRARRRKR